MHVVPILSAYLRKYPDVTGELVLSDGLANLVEDGIDVAVRIGVLEDSSLVARCVGHTRRVVVASPAYLAAHKRLRTPDDLAAHRLLSAEWRFAGGVRRVKPAVTTNSIDAAIAMAILGDGLASVMAYQVADAIKAGRLRVVLKAHELPPVPIHTVYPSTRLLSAKVRTFVEMVALATKMPRGAEW